jgi:hypothetical protein
MKCRECGGKCTEILLGLLKALGIPKRCEMCHVQESEAVKISSVGGELLCYFCAVEAFD